MERVQAPQPSESGEHEKQDLKQRTIELLRGLRGAFIGLMKSKSSVDQKEKMSEKVQRIFEMLKGLINANKFQGYSVKNDAKIIEAQVSDDEKKTFGIVSAFQLPLLCKLTDGSIHDLRLELHVTTTGDHVLFLSASSKSGPDVSLNVIYTDPKRPQDPPENKLMSEFIKDPSSPKFKNGFSTSFGQFREVLAKER